MARKLSRIRGAAQVISLSKALRWGYSAALWTIAVIIFFTSIDAFAQSYRGLFLLSVNYLHVPEPFAALWPLLVDAFPITGEIRLFTAAVKAEKSWHVRIWGWGLTIGGGLLSVGGNVIHEGLHAATLQMGGNALPPLAAAAMLGTGLGMVKNSVAEAYAAHQRQKTVAVNLETPPPEKEQTKQRRPKSAAPGISDLEERRARLEKARAEVPQALAEDPDLSEREIHRRWGISRYSASQLLKDLEAEEAQHG